MTATNVANTPGHSCNTDAEAQSYLDNCWLVWVICIDIDTRTTANQSQEKGTYEFCGNTAPKMRRFNVINCLGVAHFSFALKVLELSTKTRLYYFLKL